MVWTLLLLLSAQVQPAPEYTSSPVAVAVAPTLESGTVPPAKNPLRVAVEKAGRILVGVPLGAVALGVAGVSGIMALMVMTTEPETFGITGGSETNRERAWTAVRVTAVGITVLSGCLAVALFLFPFTTVAGMFQES